MKSIRDNARNLLVERYQLHPRDATSPPMPDGERLVFGDAPENELRSFLVIPPVAVAAQDVATMTACPQVDCHPVRLVVDPECASFFDVIFVCVGQAAQLLSHCGEDGVPATFFPPLPASLSESDRELFDALLRIKWDPIKVNQFFQIGVRNRSDQTRKFRATLWCDTGLHDAKLRKVK